MDASSVYLIFLSVVALILTLAVTRLYRNEIKKMFKIYNRNMGLSVGDRLPQNSIRDLHGTPVEIFHPKIRGTIMIFTSLGCNACKSLYPILSNYQFKYADLKVMTFTVGDRSDVLAMIEEYKLTVPVAVINEDDKRRYGISSLPFAYFVTPDGRIAAKSIVNYEEHLDALVGAAQFSSYTKTG